MKKKTRMREFCLLLLISHANFFKYYYSLENDRELTIIFLVKITITIFVINITCKVFKTTLLSSWIDLFSPLFSCFRWNKKNKKMRKWECFEKRGQSEKQEHDLWPQSERKCVVLKDQGRIRLKGPNYYKFYS